MTAQEPLWWQHGVVYQIYPRSYQDSNGDGIGDIPGIVARLDYLAQVCPVDAIWLSPFYPSPMADFGYDVADYTAVDPMFGTLQDFDRLVQEAHRRDIRIIIDFVPNHTSEQHPWFLESRSSRDNPKRDWYFWRDAKPAGEPPNNWLAHFGGTSWEWDEHTRQYYLHSFLKEQPDLNWRNPEVRAAMYDALRFWLERGVDGFRIDVAHFILKDPNLADNPPNPNGQESPRLFDHQLHINDMMHPDVHQAFREIRNVLNEYEERSPRMSVGEIYHHHWPTWASFYGEQLDELHMPFNFRLLHIPWTAEAVRDAVNQLEEHLPPGATPNFVLGNHDQHRIASRVGEAQARVGMMLLLTLRGTPTMYYGDEIGMHDVEIPLDRIQDPFEINVPGLGLGRDPERTPMQWDPGPNAGFCPPGVEPWLPIAADYHTINVETESNRPGSFLQLSRELLLLRRATPALNRGTYRPLPSPPGVFSYEREWQGERWVIALNFTPEPHVSRLEEIADATVALSTIMDRSDLPVTGDLMLRPNEGVVLHVTR